MIARGHVKNYLSLLRVALEAPSEFLRTKGLQRAPVPCKHKKPRLSTAASLIQVNKDRNATSSN